MIDRYYNKTTNTEWFNTYTGHELEQLTSDPAPVGDIISARPVPESDPPMTRNIYNTPDALPVDVVILPPEHAFWQPPPTNGDEWGFDIDGLPELNVYIGGPIELQTAITDRQNEIADYYKGLHGIRLDLAESVANAPQPAFVLAANAVTNIGVAAIAIVFVGALLNKAAVDAFNVAGEPWV